MNENELNPSVDLSNKEAVVLDYMQERLKAKYPNLNIGNRSPFMETFGLTHLSLLQPIFERADRFMLMQSLDNTKELTEEELNFIAGRYGKERKQGTVSNGLAYFVYNSIPKEGIIVIPADYQVSSSKGVSFFVNATMTLMESQLATYFDASRFIYRIPVPMTSVETGSENNIEAGALENGIVPLSGLVSIENDEAFVNGTDKESNEDFANRIKQEGYADNFGVDAGYRAFAKDFRGFEDINIVGMGHPLMKRDIIGTANRNVHFKQEVFDVHIGGKVDLYLRGFDLQTAAEILPVVKLPEGGLGFELNVKPVHDIIQVRYFDYDGQLEDPSVDQSLLYISDYVLEKQEDFEDEGTLNERSYVRLFDPKVNTSHKVEVQYRYNRLVQNIYDGLYNYSIRPPATDVKPKLAHAKYVYGSMTVKAIEQSGLSRRDTYLIQERIRMMFKTQKLGYPIQFSDIQLSMTEQSVWKENALNLIDSIRIPATTFFVAKNPSPYAYYVLGEAQRAFVQNIKNEQPFLMYVFDQYQDRLRTVEFFDTLHAMFMDDDAETRFRELEQEPDMSGQTVMMLREMRTAFDESLVMKLLAPNELSCSEIEYFEMGDIFIQDDIIFDTENWKQLLQVVANIALGDRVSETYSEMLELMAFVLTLSFVYAKQDDVTGREDELYAFLDRAFRNTSARGMIELRKDVE